MEEELSASVSESLPGYTEEQPSHGDDQGDRGEYSADFSEESNTSFVPSAATTGFYPASTAQSSHQEKNVRFDVESVASEPAYIPVQTAGSERKQPTQPQQPQQQRPQQPARESSTQHAHVTAPAPVVAPVYKSPSSMGPSHRLSERSKETNVRVPASEVQSLEHYAVTTALGLHRPKMVGSRAAQPTVKASRLPTSSFPQPASTTTASANERTALRGNTLAGLGDAVSNDMLLDLLAGSVAVGRDIGTGSVSKGSTTPLQAPSSPSTRSVHRALIQPVDIDHRARTALTEDASRTLEGVRGEVGSGWADAFDTIYAHAVMSIPRLCVEAAINTVPAKEHTPLDDEELIELQVAHESKRLKNESNAQLLVAQAVTAALQDLLSDTPIVTLVREAVARCLLPVNSADDTVLPQHVNKVLTAMGTSTSTGIGTGAGIGSGSGGSMSTTMTYGGTVSGGVR